jgi:hypothetical protein
VNKGNVFFCIFSQFINIALLIGQSKAKQSEICGIYVFWHGFVKMLEERENDGAEEGRKRLFPHLNKSMLQEKVEFRSP